MCAHFVKHHVYGGEAQAIVVFVSKGTVQKGGITNDQSLSISLSGG